MKFKIYNYKNEIVEKELECNEKDIKSITVKVLSGDEVVDVMTKNNISYHYDAAIDRGVNFFEGNYVLNSPKLINAWLNWSPHDESSYSYGRMEMMTKLLELDSGSESTSIDSLIDQLKEIEDVLAADSSGIEYVRTSKFYVGAALLLLNAAKKEGEKDLC